MLLQEVLERSSGNQRRNLEIEPGDDWDVMALT